MRKKTAIALLVPLTVVTVVALSAWAQPDDAPTAGAPPAPGILAGPRIMQEADADQDGSVTEQEFLDAQKKHFEHLDANGDGKIDQQERTERMNAMRDRMGELRGHVRDRVRNHVRDQVRDRRHQALFDRADADNDGRVSAEEFPGRPGRFSDIDTDGDGYLSPEDIAAVAPPVQRPGWGQGTGRQSEPMHRPGAGDRQGRPDGPRPPALEELDKNEDGKISRKEFRAGWESRFEKLDANDDGYVTQDEMSFRGRRGAGRGQVGRPAPTGPQGFTRGPSSRG
ncbi:EF-hand domain-containing protein [Candidatus Sumerlaeota bacterium]|nr:EF-hand domain-containing protein [Candidatus Sumerlaeota bacterium]